MSRPRSNLGANNSGQDSSTGLESTRSSPGSELETIDTQNRAAVAAMSATEIAEAQAELMGRLRPEVLDMLKRRGLKKGQKGHKEDKSEDLHPTGSTHVLPHQKHKIAGEPEKETSAYNYDLEKVRLSREEEQGTPSFHVKRGELEKETGVESAVVQGETLNTKQEIEISSVEFNRDVVRKETVTPQEEVLVHIEGGAADVKSWTERVEAVRLYRFDLEGNLVGIDEPPIPSIPGTSLFTKSCTVLFIMSISGFHSGSHFLCIFISSNLNRDIPNLSINLY